MPHSPRGGAKCNAPFSCRGFWDRPHPSGPPSPSVTRKLSQNRPGINPDTLPCSFPAKGVREPPLPKGDFRARHARKGGAAKGWQTERKGTKRHVNRWGRGYFSKSLKLLRIGGPLEPIHPSGYPDMSPPDHHLAPPNRSNRLNCSHFLRFLPSRCAARTLPRAGACASRSPPGGVGGGLAWPIRCIYPPSPLPVPL
jgi:hypothetical protein